MTDTSHRQARAQVAAVLTEIDTARGLLQSHKYKQGAHSARLATEGMLIVVADHVLPLAQREDRMSLERAIQVLRAAKTLRGGVVTHVKTIQDFGNAASHFQRSMSDEVTEHDAIAVSHALDAVVEWFHESMPQGAIPSAPTMPADAPSPAVKVRSRTAPAAPPPYVPPPSAPPPAAHARPAAPASPRAVPEPAPPPPGKSRRKGADAQARSWLQTAGLALVALAAPFLGFVGMVAVLGWFGPADRTMSEPAAAAPAPALEADPGADAPVLSATAAADAADVVRKQISAELDLSPDALGGLGCSELARSRNWLWVRHGYVLKDPHERVVLGSLAHGVRPAATAREIHREFTPHDLTNQALLEQALRSAGCPCPAALRPDRPCPE